MPVVCFRLNPQSAIEIIMSWYLRSMADYDTHYGEFKDGIVTATCGAEFWPRVLTFDRRALPRYPPDPQQVCPECQQHIRAVTPGLSRRAG